MVRIGAKGSNCPYVSKMVQKCPKWASNGIQKDPKNQKIVQKGLKFQKSLKGSKGAKCVQNGAKRVQQVQKSPKEPKVSKRAQSV